MAPRKKPETDGEGVAAETVEMIRDPDQYPEPHTADVHPDEVENYAAAGWERA